MPRGEAGDEDILRAGVVAVGVDVDAAWRSPVAGSGSQAGVERRDVEVLRAVADLDGPDVGAVEGVLRVVDPVQLGGSPGRRESRVRAAVDRATTAAVILRMGVLVSRFQRCVPCRASSPSVGTHALDAPGVEKVAPVLGPQPPTRSWYCWTITRTDRVPNRAIDQTSTPSRTPRIRSSAGQDLPVDEDQQPRVHEHHQAADARRRSRSARAAGRCRSAARRSR